MANAELARRAAKLSRLPGVTIAEAAKRFGVSVYSVRRSRRDPALDTTLSLAELALAALTNNGLEPSFTLGDLRQVASWVDYVNHDGCTPEDVRALLQSLADSGVIELGAESGRLLVAWP
jgi:hypothetical protein